MDIAAYRSRLGRRQAGPGELTRTGERDDGTDWVALQVQRSMTAPSRSRGEVWLAELDKTRPVIVLTRDPMGRRQA